MVLWLESPFFGALCQINSYTRSPSDDDLVHEVQNRSVISVRPVRKTEPKPVFFFVELCRQSRKFGLTQWLKLSASRPDKQSNALEDPFRCVVRQAGPSGTQNFTKT